MLPGGHLFQLVVDLPGTVTGSDELFCLREWLAEVFPCVGGLSLGVLDVGQDAGLAVIQPGEPVLQAGDQRAVIAAAEIGWLEVNAGSGCPVEGDGDGGFAVFRSLEGCGYQETAELADVDGVVAVPVELGGFLLDRLGEVLSGVCAAGVLDAADSHGELASAGVLAAAYGGVGVVSLPGEIGDSLFEAGDGVPERLLAALVGAFGALEPGQFGVGFCFVDEQRVACG